MSVYRGVKATALVLAVIFTTACGTIYAQGRPNYPNYPNSPGGRGGVYRGGYQDPAFTRGFDDGYRRGLDAVRDGDRYDVRRESWYRDGDRGYDRRYGSRTEWRQIYRDGFAQGYDRGYREGRYQYNNRSNGGWRRW